MRPPRLVFSLVPLSTFFGLVIIPGLSSASPPTPPTPSSAESQTSVTLFGQKCSLKGPVTPHQLKTIHQISPEQTPAPDGARSAEAILQKLIEIKSLRDPKKGALPTPLENYRSRLEKYFRGYAMFYESLSAFEQKKDLALFQSQSEMVIHPKRWQEALAALKAPVATAEIKELYSQHAQPHPEEEFHRTIQRMGVSYQCDFNSADEPPTLPAQSP